MLSNNVHNIHKLAKQYNRELNFVEYEIASQDDKKWYDLPAAQSSDPYFKIELVAGVGFEPTTFRL